MLWAQGTLSPTHIQNSEEEGSLSSTSKLHNLIEGKIDISIKGKETATPQYDNQSLEIENFADAKEMLQSDYSNHQTDMEEIMNQNYMDNDGNNIMNEKRGRSDNEVIMACLQNSCLYCL